EAKKKYWQQPDWDCLSSRRKYPWKLSVRSEWQDILSTYDCLIDDVNAAEVAAVKLECVFHEHSATDSTNIRPPVPR
ncbi:MAG: hypothetical protein ACO37Y_12610, partial [Steroidobacteraceae bacterium]